jgi:transglutaminase-like putative cysteine protease
MSTNLSERTDADPVAATEDPLAGRVSWLDVAILALAVGLVMLAATLTRQVFFSDDVIWRALFAPLVAGVVALALPRRLPLPLRITAHLITQGGLLLLTVRAYGGTLPGDALRAVVRGIPVVLSSRWPTPIGPVSVGAVVLACGIAGVVAAELARSERQFAVSLLAPSVALLGICAFLAAPAGPPSPLLLALWVAGALLLLYLAAQRSRPAAFRRLGSLSAQLLPRATPAVALALVAALVVPFVGGSASAEGRYDPRESRNDPADLEDEVSPLALVDAIRDRDPVEDQLTVSTAQFLRWRQVGLTRYDGRAWMPSAEFRAWGGESPSEAGETVVDVQVEDLTGRWVPAVEGVEDVDLPVLVDDTRSGVLAEEALASGDRYQLTVVRPPNVDLQSTVAARRESAIVRGVEIPLGLVTLATTVTAGAATDFDRAARLAGHLQTSYALDPEAPPGHGLGLLTLFLEDTRVGRREQFVAAYGVLAAAIGLPVRITVGWIVPSAASGGITLRSADMTAWPEVEFEEAGWVPFDPVPGSAIPPSDQEQRVAPRGVQGALPPPADEPPPPVNTAAPREITDLEAGSSSLQLSTPVKVGLAALLVVAVIALGLFAVVAAKSRRRRRLHHAENPATRVTGAFAVSVDMMMDLGMRVQHSKTDSELAVDGVEKFGRELVPTGALAMRATRAVYDVEETSPEDAEAAWRDVDAIEDALRRRTARVSWWRSKLSLRSVRNGLTRSMS